MKESTIEQKNITIAEMLGWRKGHRNFPQEQRWKDDWFDRNEMRYTHLAFHSNANWQYEALQFILEQEIVQEDMELYYTITDQIPDKEAVFEALYQFSQYIKQKKDG